MNVRVYLTAALLLLSVGFSFGQKAWMEPADATPTDSVSLFVDISLCDCQRLVGHAGPLYIWTWQPGDPVVGNGQWTASNTDLEMTHVQGDVWKITFIPVDFYGVDAATVYANDFHFLAKAFDGTGLGGGGCDEDKTEDLMVTIDPPVPPVLKVKAFPGADSEDTVHITPKDVFSVIYDNNQEEKVTLQGVQQLYVYTKAYFSDGTTNEISPITQVGNFPELEMTNNGDGTFTFSIIPMNFFGGDDTKQVVGMDFQVLRPFAADSDDVVDGTFSYGIKCD